MLFIAIGLKNTSEAAMPETGHVSFYSQKGL